MSAINRSLANIRTELDFLRDSKVITDETFNKINDSLPMKYDPNASRDSVSTQQTRPVEWAEALYEFKPQQEGDLELHPGDKIEILEKPSAEWFKGRCNGRVGMFPTNYIKQSFSGANTLPLQQQQPQFIPPSANSSQQFPPPSTNYYQQQPQVVTQQPAQQEQQPQQHQHHASGALKKFGSKLGNAAIFGAGATIGGDIVNSIF